MDEILRHWPIILAFILALIWLVRLEAKVLWLGRDHEKLEKSVAEKDKLLWEKFDAMRSDVTQILQAIARLEGRLSERREKE
jgi:hypothetical protein